jgi:hypothetical protein
MGVSVGFGAAASVWAIAVWIAPSEGGTGWATTAQPTKANAKRVDKRIALFIGCLLFQLKE